MQEIYEIANKKGIQVVHANVRSILHKLPELENSFRNFDILIFTETWLTKSILSSALHINGFNLVRQDRVNVSKKSGAGIVCYINSEMDYTVSNSSVVSSDYEILGIEVKPKNVRTLHVFGIYRPPDGKVENFIDYIEEAVGKLDRQRSEVTMIGDYNLDYTNDNLLRKYKLNPLEKKLNMR